MERARARPAVGETRSGFSYSSGENDQWLTVDDLRALVADYQKKKGAQ